jgi:hypothetical protein
MPQADPRPEVAGGSGALREVSDEKVAATVRWARERLAEDAGSKGVVWCRFRHEALRTAAALREATGARVESIVGAQPRADRERARRLLHPRTAPPGPAFVTGTTAAGGASINLAAAWLTLYQSHDFSLRARLQSVDRVHRPGQRRPVRVWDMAATGPRGQRTVDHAVIEALREKRDVADWVTSAWRRELDRQRAEDAA